MLDLFCGLGGASAAFRDAGWEVIGVDIEEKFHPEIVADLTNWHWTGGHVDLVWASPPCVEFSRKGQPGLFPNEPEPSMDLVNAARRIIREVEPDWWVIENVVGSIPYIGPNFQRVRSFILWGNIPPLGSFAANVGFKGGHSYKTGHQMLNWYSHDPAVRALVPREISERVLYVITHQPRFEWAASVS